jgi:hypothetical protein
LLCRSEGLLACHGPGAAVSDGGQFAAPDPGEEAAVLGQTEADDVIAEQPGQFGMHRHNAAVALGSVLELPPLPRTAIVGPLAARIGGCAAQMQVKDNIIARRGKQARNIAKVAAAPLRAHLHLLRHARRPRPVAGRPRHGPAGRRMNVPGRAQRAIAVLSGQPPRRHGRALD